MMCENHTTVHGLLILTLDIGICCCCQFVPNGIASTSDAILWCGTPAPLCPVVQPIKYVFGCTLVFGWYFYFHENRSVALTTPQISKKVHAAILLQLQPPPHLERSLSNFTFCLPSLVSLSLCLFPPRSCCRCSDYDFTRSNDQGD